MTERIVRAMSHPRTTMLGHLTGRLLLSRPEYAVNIPKILEAAEEYGVVVELNANPHRLDIDWRHLKELKKRNLLVSINPDAHRMDGLSHVRYGVGIARKGWLTAEHVLNTRPLKSVLDFLRKRT
jgi:DNA polymerase (family 10)